MAEMNQEELEAKLIEEYPLFFLEMNRAQELFIRCKNINGETPRTRLFEAGNKIGKCTSFQALISTPSGEFKVGELYKKGKPFDVYAWDGNKKVIAKAHAPFKKEGLHKCYRIEMSDGRVIEAADEHLVLTSSGCYSFVHDIYEAFQAHRESNSGTFPSVPLLNAPRLKQREQDSRYDCLMDCDQDGEQLLREVRNDQFSVPSRDGSQERNFVLRKGGYRSKYMGIFRPFFSHLSNLCDLPRYEVLSVESLVQDAYRFFLRCIGGSPAFQQLAFAGDIQPQPCSEFSQSFLSGSPLSGTVISSYNPPLVDGNHIININPIDVKQEVYDFTVEKYHNYFAGGLIHHNTHGGIAEDIAHSMGFRPWLYEDDPDYKIKIKIPNQGLIACETMMHSVPEKIDPTLRLLIPKTCKPKFKPGPTGITIRVTLPYDCNGKKCGSVIHIRSYDQQADSFEGIDYDWVHYDEPPPEETYKAVERGKVVTNAPTWFTMTPLKEAWVYDILSLKASVVV